MDYPHASIRRKINLLEGQEGFREPKGGKVSWASKELEPKKKKEEDEENDQESSNFLLYFSKAT